MRVLTLMLRSASAVKDYSVIKRAALEVIAIDVDKQKIAPARSFMRSITMIRALLTSRSCASP